MMIEAILSLVFIVHVCLVFTTGHSSFWWLARLLDAGEAAQRATVLCLVPCIRLWKRQFLSEWRRLQGNQM